MFLLLLILNFLLPFVLGAGQGKWGPTIKFPLVPVAGAVIPGSGKLLVWSAYAVDRFRRTYSNITQTAVYDPADGSVQEIEVTNINHDMFCPGISFDFNGNIMVTGGDTAPAASLFSPSSMSWSQAPQMVIGRGYQSSTTLSDGRIFTIGGSWSGGKKIKNGEVFDGTSWKLMNGCAVTPMLTKDPQGISRADNHGWLFSWSNGTVFQGGPSVAMNWYYPTGTGSWKAAGTRPGNDAMCGPAAMYDAVAGKILSVGGSPAYIGDYATTNAQITTIGAPGQAATVQTISPMAEARIFATSTILPTGAVLVIGGQTFGHTFSDSNASMIPELWKPLTGAFSPMAQQPEARNYHSISVLMPDGTVFSGGGGLCGPKCKSNNHFTGQIFTPPYLFQADGVTPAIRPTINSISATTLHVGDKITVSVEPASATCTFAMIRYGTSTHTVNTDQRRIPLVATSPANGTYTMQLPSDPGVLLPGYWHFFALKYGVPSISTTILIQP